MEDSLTLREILNTYLELRQHFQELGFSEPQLEKPPSYTPTMMRLFHKFGDTQKALFNQVKDYGFDVTFTEFMSYMKPLMDKINELTPLEKNGNIKRRNQRDED